MSGLLVFLRRCAKTFLVFPAIILLLNVLSLPASSQAPEKSNSGFDKSRFPGIRIDRDDIFTANALWGYMNGGADLYLEYGTQALQVMEFSWNGMDWKAEVYRLGDAFSAYALFSSLRFKCQATDSLSSVICFHSGQILAWKADQVLNLFPQRLNLPEGSKDWYALMKGFDFPGKEAEVPIPAFLQKAGSGRWLNDLLIIKGPLGLRNYEAWLADWLDGLRYTLFRIPPGFGQVPTGFFLLEADPAEGLEARLFPASHAIQGSNFRAAETPLGGIAYFRKTEDGKFRILLFHLATSDIDLANILRIMED